jgi:hypothetical protein
MESFSMENQSAQDVEKDNARVAAEGEADEPDAPTAEEENEGMSTILSAEPMLGVQEDAGEE